MAQVLSLNYRALPEDAALCSCGVEEPKIGQFEGQIAYLIPFKDYSIFSRESQPKPSFVTGILGGGVDLRYR